MMRLKVFRGWPLLFTCLLVFQNCSRVQTASGNQSFDAKGNGDVYSGKTYINYLTVGVCADGTTVNAVIKSTPETYQLTRSSCLDLVTPVVLPSSAIVESADGKLSYNALSFTASPSSPAPLDETPSVDLPAQSIFCQVVPLASSGAVSVISGSWNIQMRAAGSFTANINLLMNLADLGPMVFNQAELDGSSSGTKFFFESNFKGQASQNTLQTMSLAGINVGKNQTIAVYVTLATTAGQKSATFQANCTAQ